MLCLFLAIYAFAAFGYVTGTIATYFIGRDTEEDNAAIGRSLILPPRKWPGKRFGLDTRTRCFHAQTVVTKSG